jgi:hypothetical protein
MARAGIPDEVAERAIGHKVGSALMEVYNQHKYMEEKRKAFLAVEELVRSIVQ